MNESLKLKEGIVLDRDGTPLTGPQSRPTSHSFGQFSGRSLLVRGWPALVLAVLFLPVIGVGVLITLAVLATLFIVSRLLAPLFAPARRR